MESKTNAPVLQENKMGVMPVGKLYSQTNIDGIKHIHLRDFLKMTTLP